MKRFLLILISMLFFVSLVDAKYRQECKVKYRKDYGWSQYYTIEVTFVAGYELNQATGTFNYSSGLLIS